MAIYGSYSEIYDMNTVDNKISALKFHTPQDGAPVEHLGGLFAQFRKYKYLGADFALIPAQQLPLDPLQVTSVDGDGLADPRDVLNPILYKHWNGERTLLDNYLDEEYTREITGTGGIGHPGDHEGDPAMGQSIDEVEIPIRGPQDSSGGSNAQQFYAMQLMDNSFKVSHVQEALRIKMKPKVWNVQAQRPITSVRTETDLGNGQWQGEMIGGAGMGLTPRRSRDSSSNDNVQHGRIPVMRTGQQGGASWMNEQEFLTSSISPMGWLPTNNTYGGIGHTGTEKVISELSRVRLPKIYMHLMILPPAYKTNFYYRLVMKHRFLFKDLTSLKAIDSIDASIGWNNRVQPFLPTAKSRLELLGEASTYSEGHRSSIEAFNVDLVPMGGRFDFEEGVGDDYGEEDEVAPQTMEEQIDAILNAREANRNKDKTE